VNVLAASSTLTANARPVEATSEGWRVGKRISHDFRNGGSFFMPGNDSLCVHTHSAAARRETENMAGFNAPPCTLYDSL